MEYILFILISIMAVRTASFGISTITDRNIAGGIAVIVLAVLSVVCGGVVLY